MPASVMQASNQSGLESLINWVGNDAAAIDSNAMCTHLQGAGILLPDEMVAMAFKAGRDSFILTSKRILIIDVQGFSGKRVAYNSVPYSSIRAFSVESAGTFDRDAEVKIFTRNHWSLSKLGQDLRKGKADILAIQQYICEHVFGTYDDSSGQFKTPEPSVGDVSSFLGWLGDDSHQINSEEVNKQLHEQTKILLPNETVEMAFKCGRDMYVHTTMRMLFVDVQGFTGKKVEYESIPLKYCTGFEVVTAGGMLDRDAELYVFTDVPAKGRISQDLRKGKCDVFEVQKMLASKLIIR